MAVTELGYMGLGVSDLDAWKKFAREILALEVVDEGEKDRCYLRMDYWHHRLVLHRDPSDDLAYLGFRVAGPEEFIETQKQLADAGIEFRVGSLEEAEERRVLEVMKLADPDGNPIEIFHGPLVRFAKPFHPGRGMHGKFVTGAGGLGHCIIRQRDSEAAVRFYQALGMRGGVEYKFGSGARTVQLRFMHCNERDHSVAWGIGARAKRLNHIMIEVDNLDDVGTHPRAGAQAKIPVHIQLGQALERPHVLVLLPQPVGLHDRVGFGARPATHQSEYFVQDFYGHRPEDGGF